MAQFRMTKFHRHSSHVIGGLSAWLLVSGCTFKFEMTSQRTALENQVMGSYKELDDDVVLMVSVRGVNPDGTTKKKEASDFQMEAVRAKQNQEFNRDDLDEMKSGQLIGEASDGRVAILPAGIGASDKATPQAKAFGIILVEEENRDRASIWGRIVQSNQNLTQKELPEVRRTFAQMQFDAGQVGHWFQDAKGAWRQKMAGNKK